MKKTKNRIKFEKSSKTAAGIQSKVYLKTDKVLCIGLKHLSQIPLASMENLL